MKRIAPWVVFLAVCTLSSCDRGVEDAHPPVLNLFIWSDYLGPDTLKGFEKSTGIKTHVLFFDTNETLETQLLAGQSEFDIVLPSAPYFQRQIAAGAFRQLDRTKLPHWGNLDPELMSIVSKYDPGNAHGAIYLWGTEGLAFNPALVNKHLPGVAVDSWKLIFDPAYAAKLAPCGIHLLDNPAGVIRIVLNYLGRDPNAPSAADLDDAERTLRTIRPYVHSIDSSAYVSALANGEICVALAYNGDAAQARDRARESGTRVDPGFVVPKEGGIIWFDMIGIPQQAPNLQSAYAFLDYVLQAPVMADVSNAVRYANANRASQGLIHADVVHDPIIYPSADERRRLFVQLADDDERARALTRIWQRFKTGQ